MGVVVTRDCVVAIAAIAIMIRIAMVVEGENEVEPDFSRP